MAWTAPRTWVTDEVVSASQLNTHVRDNLLETAPAKATASGELFEATGANALQATNNPVAVMVWGMIG
jgi:hypothetical protein